MIALDFTRRNSYFIPLRFIRYFSYGVHTLFSIRFVKTAKEEELLYLFSTKTSWFQISLTESANSSRLLKFCFAHFGRIYGLIQNVVKYVFLSSKTIMLYGPKYTTNIAVLIWLTQNEKQATHSHPHPLASNLKVHKSPGTSNCTPWMGPVFIGLYTCHGLLSRSRTPERFYTILIQRKLKAL